MNFPDEQSRQDHGLKKHMITMHGTLCMVPAGTKFRRVKQRRRHKALHRLGWTGHAEDVR